jgi:5-methylcytosine-specific restriction endonuclease McrA
MKGKDWSFCEPCYFKKTSTDCLKTAKHAEVIGQKLKDQNYRCAYTGEEIILGLNDSLDHILPISKFPELRSDPANVEWVTRKVNCMKWDSTRDEFIATAYAVVRHYESQRQLVA